MATQQLLLSLFVLVIVPKPTLCKYEINQIQNKETNVLSKIMHDVSGHLVHGGYVSSSKSYKKGLKTLPNKVIQKIEKQTKAAETAEIKRCIALTTACKHIFTEHQRQGTMHLAVDLFYGYAARAPMCPGVLRALGGVLIHTGKLDEGARMYSWAMEVGRSMNSTFTKEYYGDNMVTSSYVALRFAKQQLEELVKLGKISSSYKKEIAEYNALLPLVPTDIKLSITLRPEDAISIPSYRRVVHIEHKPRMDTSPLQPRTDIDEVQEKYMKEGLIVLDNLLKPEALKALHEFAALSTMYFDSKYGYLGSYLEEGFYTPLLAQVQEDLAYMFPKIFKGHKLLQSWAYNYDDGDQSGIQNHGDDAAVNCNLWLTPDSANIDKKSGGLIVHKTPAPLHWDFDSMNSPAGNAKMQKLIKSGESVTVPYKENRVVIFKSDLIHATDKFKFKKGFKNRRINLTMLYGYRGAAKDSISKSQRDELYVLLFSIFVRLHVILTMLYGY
eukprot:m.258882 g.258882  ORF g.258882 m.258882 type:complete len:498 (-) comp16199_c0_seq10:169-1662(-)